MSTPHLQSPLSRWLAWLPAHGHSLRRLLGMAWFEYERDYARYFAVAMVYYALVSLVPLLLLLLAALGWLLRLSSVAADFEQRVLAAVDQAFGFELRDAIDRLLDGLRDQSVVSTVVSLVALVLTASVLVRQLRLSLRAIWKHAPPLLSGSLQAGAWAAFLEKAIAFVMVLAGGLVLVGALAIVVGVHWVSGMLSGLPVVSMGLELVLATALPFLIVFLIFALLFMFLPPVWVPFRHVWLAALICAAAWFIGIEILALYGLYLRGNVSTYGALGAALIVMLWLKVVSQLFFFGAELCKVASLTSAIGTADRTNGQLLRATRGTDDS